MTQITPYTPRSRMYYRKMLRLFNEFYESMASEYDVTPDEFFEEITEFAMFSVRIELNGNNPLDFELLKPTDSLKDVQSKVRAYMDNQSGRAWRDLELKIMAFDEPTDDDLAPHVEISDPNAKSGVASSKGK